MATKMATIEKPPYHNSRVMRGLLRYEKCGGACGIRTRDLRLERAASWATRRMRRGLLAAGLGFEPKLTDPESAVLPLHHPAGPE